MINFNTWEDALTTIIKDYVDTYSIVDLIVPEYRIVDDIADAYLMLRPDVLENSSLSVEDLRRYNGFTVPPKNNTDVFTVLLNKNIAVENMRNHRMDWIGTLVHETTHVQDYFEYARIVNTSIYDEILSISGHGMFNLWTEVNARSRGYYFTRKYTVGEENLHNDGLISDIVERELPWQQDYMFRQYHATTDGFQQAYYVAQYIGRLYTLQQLYPDQFNNNWISQHFGMNNWMTEWFFFFKDYPVLADAAKHFEDMKNILRTNFRGL